MINFLSTFLNETIIKPAEVKLDLPPGRPRPPLSSQTIGKKETPLLNKLKNKYGSNQSLTINTSSQDANFATRDSSTELQKVNH